MIKIKAQLTYLVIILATIGHGATNPPLCDTKFLNFDFENPCTSGQSEFSVAINNLFPNRNIFPLRTKTIVSGSLMYLTIGIWVKISSFPAEKSLIWRLFHDGT